MCDNEEKHVDNQENQFIWDLCYPVSFHWVICQGPNVLPEGGFPFIYLFIYSLNCSNLQDFLHHLNFESIMSNPLISSHLKLHIWMTTIMLGDDVQFSTCRSWDPLISDLLTRYSQSMPELQLTDWKLGTRMPQDFCKWQPLCRWGALTPLLKSILKHLETPIFSKCLAHGFF